LQLDLPQLPPLSPGMFRQAALQHPEQSDNNGFESVYRTMHDGEYKTVDQKFASEHAPWFMPSAQKMVLSSLSAPRLEPLPLVQTTAQGKDSKESKESKQEKDDPSLGCEAAPVPFPLEGQNYYRRHPTVAAVLSRPSASQPKHGSSVFSSAASLQQGSASASASSISASSSLSSSALSSAAVATPTHPVVALLVGSVIACPVLFHLPPHLGANPKTHPSNQGVLTFDEIKQMRTDWTKAAATRARQWETGNEGDEAKEDEGNKDNGQSRHYFTDGLDRTRVSANLLRVEHPELTSSHNNNNNNNNSNKNKQEGGEGTEFPPMQMHSLPIVAARSEPAWKAGNTLEFADTEEYTGPLANVKGGRYPHYYLAGLTPQPPQPVDPSRLLRKPDLERMTSGGGMVYMSSTSAAASFKAESIKSDALLDSSLRKLNTLFALPRECQFEQAHSCRLKSFGLWQEELFHAHDEKTNANLHDLNMLAIPNESQPEKMERASKEAKEAKAAKEHNFDLDSLPPQPGCYQCSDPVISPFLFFAKQENIVDLQSNESFTASDTRGCMESEYIDFE